MKSLPRRDHARRRLLLLAGIWLLLTAAIIVIQLTAPVEIEVEWATETESETAGFNIYRSESPEGDFIQINDHLIPSRGNVTTGASYTYRDRRIVSEKTYFYQLEEVEYDNSRQMVDVGSARPPALKWWVWFIAGISMSIGLFLLVTGLRRQKPKTNSFFEKVWSEDGQEPDFSGEP